MACRHSQPACPYHNHLLHYEEIYQKADYRICIDHHTTNPGFGSLNFVDGKAAAAGELVYQIILELGVEITKDIEVIKAIIEATR